MSFGNFIKSALPIVGGAFGGPLGAAVADLPVEEAAQEIWAVLQRINASHYNLLLVA